MTIVSMKPDAPTSMVVLRSAKGRNCSKTFRLNEAKTGLDVEPYSKEILWLPDVVQIDGVRRLHEVIDSLSTCHDRIVVHGTIPEGTKYDDTVGVFRRTTESLHGLGLFKQQDRHWLSFDIDEVTAPDSVPTDDAALIGWLVGQMAEPVRDCSCVYQWTSSYLLSGNPRILRVRLWFWCDGPVSPQQIQEWLDTKNTVRVDNSIYRTVQPVYVNSPIFTDGAEDPVLCRVGFYQGKRDVVSAAGFPKRNSALIPGHTHSVQMDDTEDVLANREQIDDVRARLLTQRTDKARHSHALAVACELVGVGASDLDILRTCTELMRAQGREPQPNEIPNAIKTARAKAKAGTLRTSTLPVSKVFPAEPAEGPNSDAGFKDDTDGDGSDQTETDPDVEADFGKHGWLNAVRYAAKYYPTGGFVRWQENDYEWAHTHYRVMETEELRANLQRNTGLTPAVVEATMKALRSLKHASHTAAPAWLDDPNRPATNLVAFKNGVLDIDKWLLDPRTQLMPHDRGLFTLAALPVNYDMTAGCPTFDKWLPSVFPDDVEQQREFAKLLGYVFIDGNPFHKMFILLGRPRAGKGITQRLIQALVGPGNYAGTDLSLLGSQFGLANLVGRRVAIVGEMNEQRTNSISTNSIDAIKRITGGDSLGIDRKNKGIVDMALPVRFVCACNRMPAFLDPSGALADRIVLFTFRVSHSGEEDHTLESRLHNELSGIVNRALDGLRNLLVHDQRFIQPKSVKVELDLHRDAMSPVRIFAKENVEHASSATAAVDDVYAAYRQWATRDGRNPLNKSNMLKELYELFPEAARVREGGGQRRWLIRGLRLNEQGADALTGSAFD